VPIDVLVSDLGKVILPFDFTPRQQFLRQRCRLPHTEGNAEALAHALHALHEELDFGKGACSAEAFYCKVVERLNLEVSYEEFCVGYSDYFWEDWAVAELIRQARVQKRVLLSNTDAIHWQWIRKRYGALLSVFDHLLASQELQALKPHPEIYRKVEALTGHPPEAHLLIDDLAENVEGAIACGWDGIVYANVEALEAQLRTRNLLP